MGLLDSVIGALGQGAGGGQANPQAALVSAIIAMLTQGGGSAGGAGAGGGGLGGMLGSALGAGAGGAGGGSGGGSGSLGGLGGLAGLVEQFGRHGMGDIAKSWVGTGQNLPVSPDQLGQVLGGDRLGQMARQLGVDQGDLLGQLSQMLPQVVDQLTPQGRIPQGDLGGMGGADLGSLLGSLLARR
ncbi:MAG: DUF937 domain-containing protein [Rubrivivax sp.]|nr:DUF937 domain-containing protein [Rubrivivax sp.]